MSESLPERIDMRQLRRQAKELTHALNRGEPAATKLAAEFDPSLKPPKAKLADAQRLLARKYGFPSWKHLAHEVDLPNLKERFRTLVLAGDAPAVDLLLSRNQLLRRHIDDPIFYFDAPAIVQGSHAPHAEELVRVLVKHGADPNARSKWWAGGFGALDQASDAVAEVLVGLGARWDACSAAKHGRVDLLQQMLEQDSAVANAPGGDGMRPLHFAANPETVDLLVQYGADLEQKDIDHEGAPLQHQAKNPDVLRALVRHGAKPDIFTAALLDDRAMAERILHEDPSAASSRIGEPPYTTVNSNGGHIYLYTIGNSKTPQVVAAEHKSRNVLAVLLPLSSPEEQLVTAAWMGDEAQVGQILQDHPGLGARLSPNDAKSLPAAAMHGNVAAVRLLLAAGVDPMTRGMSQGTGLHIACWFGNLECVRLFLGKVPIEDRDTEHGSGPLGWATHGSMWCRNDKGDYPGVVKLLLEQGADPLLPANREGSHILDLVGDREDVKAVLLAALG